MKVETKAGTGLWTPPKSTEGPVGYGKHRPGCRDCSDCQPYLCTGGDTHQKQSLEFLPVEFARDVTLQTAAFNTSQEVVAEYLPEHPKDVCVVGAGLDDMKVVKKTWA